MTYLAWVDLETTGLDPKVDDILEVGLTITDNNHKILAETALVVGHDHGRLRHHLLCCDQTVFVMHSENGLWDASRHSNLTIQTIEGYFCNMIHTWFGEATEKPAMCGNSLTHDRIFLREFMPDLERLFHYRNHDMSSVREFMRSQFPETQAKEPARNSSNGKHRVLDDIHDSIALAKYYKNWIASGL